MNETRETSKTHKHDNSAQVIDLGTLSKLTGFPTDFIKKELLIEDIGQLDLEELRTKMVSYLEETNQAMMEDMAAQ